MYKYLIILICASFSVCAANQKTANDALKNERLTNSYICYGDIVAQITRNFENSSAQLDSLVEETCIRYGIPGNSSLCNDFFKKTITELALYVENQIQQCENNGKLARTCIKNNEALDRKIYLEKCSKKEKDDWLTMHTEIQDQLLIQQVINANRARADAEIENSAEKQHLED